MFCVMKYRELLSEAAQLFSCFHREVPMNCALLGYYEASSSNFLPKFWKNLPVPSSKGDGPDRLSRNVGKKFPIIRCVISRRSAAVTPEQVSILAWLVALCVSNQYYISCYTGCSLCSDTCSETAWAISLEKRNRSRNYTI
jgi:hypothetical protein